MDWVQRVISSTDFPSIYFVQEGNIEVDKIRTFISGMSMQFYCLDGRTISSKDDFFREVVRAFAFPTATISGWDAFLDYLRGIPWDESMEESSKGIFIVYSNIDTFAKNDPTSFSLACANVEQMQEENWQRSKLPSYFVISGNPNLLPSDVFTQPPF